MGDIVDLSQLDPTMKIQTIVLLLSTLVQMGCASQSTYHIANSALAQSEIPTEIGIALDISEDQFFWVDARPDPSERATMSQMATASLQSTPMPPGTGPGEAFAGYVASMYILKASQDASDQSEANKRADPVREIYGVNQAIELLKAEVSSYRSNENELSFIPVRDDNGEQLPEFTANLSPEINFSFDLSRLEFRFNVEVFHGGNRKPVYSNTFEYWSPSLENADIDTPFVDDWTENQGERVTLYLHEGFDELLSMLRYDVATAFGKPEYTSLPVKTHDVVSGNSSVFLRGQLVKAEDRRVWIKDLRGNFRSLPGTLSPAR